MARNFSQPSPRARLFPVPSLRCRLPFGPVVCSCALAELAVEFIEDALPGALAIGFAGERAIEVRLN